MGAYGNIRYIAYVQDRETAGFLKEFFKGKKRTSLNFCKDVKELKEQLKSNNLRYSLH